MSDTIAFFGRRQAILSPATDRPQRITTPSTLFDFCVKADVRYAVDMANPNTLEFSGGSNGRWAIEGMTTICGQGLAPAARLDIRDANAAVPNDAVWRLRGVSGQARYATRAEVDALAAVSPPLNRPEAICAAIIPIRKSTAWWALAQDERRCILEETSHHTAIGMEYLPGIARKLYHSRDLCDQFDFVTWFEFAPEHRAAFDNLCARLRATPEWAFVEREVDIRLRLAG